MRNSTEYIVECEPDGTIVGPISRTSAHSEDQRAVKTHYSTWSMVYHPRFKKYGIQQKNPKKSDKTSAGKWDMGVAGHNCYGKDKGGMRPQTFEETLVKEAKEEIGLTLRMVKSRNEFLRAARNLKGEAIGFIFDTFHYLSDTDNEWVGLGFILTPTIALRFNDEEVTQFMWLCPEQLKRFLQKNSNYCAPLPLVFEKAEEFRKDIFNEHMQVPNQGSESTVHD